MQRKSYYYALAAVVLWSTVASAFKISLRYLAPEELLLYASISSSLVLLAIIIVQGDGRKLRGLKRDDWMLSLKFGFLNPFLYYLVLFHAYDLLPAQQAQALNYSWAITLSLLAVPLLKQRIGKIDITAIGISYLGVVVISTKGNLSMLHFESPAGVGLALLSTIIWALYWIVNTKDQRDPLLGLFLNFACSIPFIFFYVLVVKGFRAISLPGLLGGMYVGFFEMGITYILWLKALKSSTNAAGVANLIFLSPFLSLVLIHFFVGEEILRSTLVGLAFIVSGLLLQSVAKMQASKSKQA